MTLTLLQIPFCRPVARWFSPRCAATSPPLWAGVRNTTVTVGFAEPRSDGGSNAKLANILEYGKHGQPAKPFLKPAKTASKQACIDAMTQRLEEEVKKR